MDPQTPQGNQQPVPPVPSVDNQPEPMPTNETPVVSPFAQTPAETPFVNPAVTPQPVSPVESQTPPQAYTNEVRTVEVPSSKKGFSKKLIILIPVILGLLALVLTAIVVFSTKGGVSPTPTPESVNEASPTPTSAYGADAVKSAVSTLLTTSTMQLTITGQNSFGDCLLNVSYKGLQNVNDFHAVWVTSYLSEESRNTCGAKNIALTDAETYLIAGSYQVRSTATGTLQKMATAPKVLDANSPLNVLKAVFGGNLSITVNAVSTAIAGVTVDTGLVTDSYTGKATFVFSTDTTNPKVVSVALDGFDTSSKLGVKGVKETIGMTYNEEVVQLPSADSVTK